MTIRTSGASSLSVLARTSVFAPLLTKRTWPAFAPIVNAWLPPTPPLASIAERSMRSPPAALSGPSNPWIVSGAAGVESDAAAKAKVSAPVPPSSLSLPVPPTSRSPAKDPRRVSLPLPPERVSDPPSPMSVSLPPPPFRALAVGLPMMRLAAAFPVKPAPSIWIVSTFAGIAKPASRLTLRMTIMSFPPPDASVIVAAR
jgi:hypothetical protein